MCRSADLAVHEPDDKNLIAFLKAMEFNALTRRVAEKGNIEAGEIEADPNLISGEIAITSPPPSSARPSRGRPGELDLGDASRTQTRGRRRGKCASRPSRSPERRIEALRAAKFEHAKYETIRYARRLEHWIARAYDTGVLALETEINSIDPMQAELCGIALAVAPNEAGYVPLGHEPATRRSRCRPVRAPSCAQARSPSAMRSRRSSRVLEDLSVLKIAHDVKPDWLVLAAAASRRAPSTTRC